MTLSADTDAATGKPRVSVVIVNYNAGARLAQCLDCLEAQTFVDFEVIVIDNGSTDGSLMACEERPSGWSCIRAGSNLGFAAANNRAAEIAQGEWLALLNPDAYAAPDWLARLVAASERYDWADAFGSTQIDAGNRDRLDGVGDVFHVLAIPYRGHFGWPVSSRLPDGECFSPCAAAALYRRSVFAALGGFDETFFCYCEDVDLGFRLRLSGRSAVQVNDAVVYHEGSGVTGRYSDFTVYHGNRNRIWTAYKCMPGIIYWPLLPVQIAANVYLLLRGFSTGTGRAYLRALKDGYGGLGRLRNARRRLQAERKVPLQNLFGMLTWSPLKVSRRQGWLRAIGRGRRA